MIGRLSTKNEITTRMADAGAAFDGGVVGAVSGIMSGARVATAMGWRSVDALEVGDKVLTFDGGLQPVTKITRRTVWADKGPAPRSFWPLRVSAGALGNREELSLLPHQFVMVESDAGEEAFGDPFSLIKAAVLREVKGIEAVMPDPDQEAVVLHFDADQVIFDKSGVLYYCPSSEGLTGFMSQAYRALSDDEADILMACIETDRAQRRLWDAEPMTASHAA